MTADVELLPLPEATMKSYQTDSTMRTMTLYSYSASDMRDYARANVAHAIAAKDAEIEALRAEVERLTFEMERLQQQYDERTACMIVHRGSALACSDAVRAAYSDEHHRAERLAEALRLALNSHGKTLLTDPPQDAWKVNRVEEIGRALLRDQENNDA